MIKRVSREVPCRKRPRGRPRRTVPRAQLPHEWGDFVRECRLNADRSKLMPETRGKTGQVTQAELARWLGVAQSTIQSWEQHRTYPQQYAIESLTERLRKLRR